MLDQIENAIVELLEQRGLVVKDVDLYDTGDSAADRKARSAAAQKSRLPAAFVAIENGAFRKISEQLIEWRPRILVAVAFKNFASDRKRRQGAVAIVETIVGLIALQTLGLDIEPIVPERFYNITDADLADKGIGVYQIEFSTGFETERPAPGQALDDLLSVVAAWDVDGGQDGEPQPIDTIELEGGTP